MPPRQRVLRLLSADRARVCERLTLVLKCFNPSFRLVVIVLSSFRHCVVSLFLRPARLPVCVSPRVLAALSRISFPHCIYLLLNPSRFSSWSCPATAPASAPASAPVLCCCVCHDACWQFPKVRKQSSRQIRKQADRQTDIKTTARRPVASSSSS